MSGYPVVLNNIGNAASESTLGQIRDSLSGNLPAQVFSYSEQISGGYFTVTAPLVGNTYIATNTADGTGFDVTKFTSVVISLEGTYSGAGIVVEQTVDPAGVSGWRRTHGRSVGLFSSLGSDGSSFCYAVSGARIRFRLVALSTGTLVARVAGLFSSEVQGRYGGTQVFRIGQAASNNSASVRNTGCTVYGYNFYNTGTSVAFVKLYNKTTAPNPSADSSLLLAVIGVPAGGSVSYTSETGMEFFTGLGVATVTGASDTNNTAVSSDQIIGQIQYA